MEHLLICSLYRVKNHGFGSSPWTAKGPQESSNFQNDLHLPALGKDIRLIDAAAASHLRRRPPPPPPTGGHPGGTAAILALASLVLGGLRPAGPNLGPRHGVEPARPHDAGAPWSRFGRRSSRGVARSQQTCTPSIRRGGPLRPPLRQGAHAAGTPLAICLRSPVPCCRFLPAAYGWPRSFRLELAFCAAAELCPARGAALLALPAPLLHAVRYLPLGM